MQSVIPILKAQPPLILALDIGSSSVRAMLFDGQGRTVSDILGRQPVNIEVSLDGAFETDPDALLEKVFLSIDEVLTRAGKHADAIAGVCCDTFVSNVMGVDADLRAVTPLILYGDTRAAPQAEELRRRLDEEYFHQKTGTRFHSSYLPARFLWWQQTLPEQMERVHRWVSIGEYLLIKLFGEASVSYSVASWTGMLDRARLNWEEELLAVLPVRREQLSPLVDANYTWRGLRAEFTARWPALAQVPWFPAIGDGAAANLGSGCATPDRVAISMGTSSAARMVVSDPTLPLPPGLWCYRVDRQRGLLGGALTEGGSVFAWAQKVFNLGGIKDLDGAVAALPPGGHGLTFLPLISGERAPGWISDARGVLSGLSIATTPVELLRSGMEGVACRIALIYDLLRDTVKSYTSADLRVIASGGAIQGSPAWQQILADALGQPLYLSTVPETSTRGAVLLALEALGQIDNIASMQELSHEVAQPDPSAYAIYRAMMARQMEMYTSLILPGHAKESEIR